MTEELRLHPISWLFLTGKAIKELALPLLAALVFGRSSEQWHLFAVIPMSIVGGLAVLRARAYRYQFIDGELLIRDGIFDRTQRHIPFARIQSVSLRRKLLHRLFRVAEVQLESASGGRPEAVMKVLSLDAAARIEALLRHHEPVIATALARDPASAGGVQVLHTMGPGEILRYGLISNRGTVMIGAAMGAIMPNEGARKLFIHYMSVPFSWIGNAAKDELAAGRWSTVLLEGLVLLLTLMVVLRLLSVILAFLKYNDFVLEREGQRLMARHGASTKVHSSARLPRLQRWVLEESWLHRRFQRCRLAVNVVGGAHAGHEKSTDASANFDELAPIATMAQARALLKICLPTLDLDTLQWQSLHPAALQRRLLGQARGLVPFMMGMTALDYYYHWRLPAEYLGAGFVLLSLAVFLYARAWVNFAALAEHESVLVFRSGVWRRQWVIVQRGRLQNMRLSSSLLDRSLGLQHFQADIQGGPRGRYGLSIPYLDLDFGRSLSERLWRAEFQRA